MPDDRAGERSGLRRRVYTGRVISLDIDTVRFPDGSLGELEIIRHPGAAAILPFVDDIRASDPRILLLKQYRYAANGSLYEVPAGRLESGESPGACAARELLEETGCTADRLTPWTTFFTTPGFTDERIHLFAASGLHRGASATEADEFIEVVELVMSRAIAMIRGGEIADAKTALALLYAASFRAQL